MAKQQKPSDKVLERLNKQKDLAARQLENARILSEGADSDFWRKVESIVKVKLSMVSYELDNFRKLSNDDRVALLQQQADLRYFLAMPDDFSRNMKLFSEKLSVITEKIREYGGE